MVMSAVSSVSTPGVLVTRMPRSRAVSRSMLSTPLPKLAINLSCGPAWAISERSMRSVTVGTSTWATRTASTSSACFKGRSSMLRRASKSSRMRVSTTSGSLRVTITRGFLGVGMGIGSWEVARLTPDRRSPSERFLSNRSRRDGKTRASASSLIPHRP